MRAATAHVSDRAVDDVGVFPFATIYARLAQAHAQWYAEAPEFQVVGVGDNPRAATQDLLDQFEKYRRTLVRRGRRIERAGGITGVWASFVIRAMFVLDRFRPVGKRRTIRLALDA